MAITSEQRHTILEDSAALLDKYYTKEAGDELRRLGKHIEGLDLEHKSNDEFMQEQSRDVENARGGLRKVVSIIDAAKIDGFDASKRGRDEAVKVLKQVRESATAALGGDRDEWPEDDSIADPDE